VTERGGWGRGRDTLTGSSGIRVGEDEGELQREVTNGVKRLPLEVMWVGSGEETMEVRGTRRRVEGEESMCVGGER
jgi:hypothetical protein